MDKTSPQMIIKISIIAASIFLTACASSSKRDKWDNYDIYMCTDKLNGTYECSNDLGHIYMCKSSKNNIICK